MAGGGQTSAKELVNTPRPEIVGDEMFTWTDVLERLWGFMALKNCENQIFFKCSSLKEVGVCLASMWWSRHPAPRYQRWQQPSQGRHSAPLGADGAAAGSKATAAWTSARRTEAKGDLL